MKKLKIKNKLWVLWTIPALIIFGILFGLSSSSKEYKNYINEEDVKKRNE